MIRTNNLKKVYLTEEVETTALDNVNVEIKEKEFVAIMGPSGCGKSTLLNLLGMLDNPTDGQVLFSWRRDFKIFRTQACKHQEAAYWFCVSEFQFDR